MAERVLGMKYQPSVEFAVCIPVISLPADKVQRRLHDLHQFLPFCQRLIEIAAAKQTRD